MLSCMGSISCVRHQTVQTVRCVVLSMRSGSEWMGSAGGVWSIMSLLLLLDCTTLGISALRAEEQLVNSLPGI